MASDDQDQDLHNLEARDLARLRENLDKLQGHLEARDKLDRVLGTFLVRVGKGQLDPDDAAMRLQAAMEDRLVVAPVADRAAEGRNDRDRSRLIADAQRAIQCGNFQRAIEIYAGLCEQDPEDARLTLKLGDCYARAGAVVQATEAYLAVARHYDAQGFHLKAVAVYKQVLKLYGHTSHAPMDVTAKRPSPPVADVFHTLAELYERLGLLSDALLAFEEFLKYAEATDERIASVRERLAELQRS